MHDPLVDAFSAAIALILEDGRYSQLYRKWFGGEPGTALHPWPPAANATFPEPQGGVLERVLRRGVLRLGHALMGPPFSHELEDTRIVGWDLDLGRLLTSVLASTYDQDLEALAVRLQPAPFPARLFDELDAQTVDAVLSDLAITEERQQRVDFAAPYLTVTFGLLCRPGLTLDSLSSADRQGFRLVVLQHAFLNELADAHLPRAERIFVADPLSMVPHLLEGRADAVLLPIASIHAYLEQANAQEAALHCADFCVGSRAFRAIAVRKSTGLYSPWPLY